MSLLSLEHVSKRYRHGLRHEEVLRDVSLELHEGELVAVWGLRHSGRSTLLRLAAGIEAPDCGVVRFRDAALRVGGGAIANGIAYCKPTLRNAEGQVVLEELIAAQLALGIRRSGARARAFEALERAGAHRCEVRWPHELDRAEAVRVCIARGLLQQPSLLLIDDPIIGVEITKRDGILELLRSLAREGTGVLACVDNGTGLLRTDRALSLSHGELRGLVSPDYAPVVELPLRVSG